MTFLTIIIADEDQQAVQESLVEVSVRAAMSYHELDAMLERIFVPPAMLYLVATSDGAIHQFRDRESFVNCIDEYGPEVVDTEVIRATEPIGGDLL